MHRMKRWFNAFCEFRTFSFKSRAQSLNPYDDDDAESGNGPSLPMSPHSVDGAIGGRRIRSVGPYDSSDDEQKHASGRLVTDNFSSRLLF